MIAVCWHGRTTPESVLPPPTLNRKKRESLQEISFIQFMKWGKYLSDKLNKIFVASRIPSKLNMKGRHGKTQTRENTKKCMHTN